jgi:transcriptional regulator with XRE-family HTH domain
MKNTKEEILFSNNLACRIETVRKDTGNWNAFSEKYDLNRRMLFRLFQEGYNPSFHTICKIAKALNVHPKELFEFSLSVKARRPEINYRFHRPGWNRKVVEYQPFK